MMVWIQCHKESTQEMGALKIQGHVSREGEESRTISSLLSLRKTYSPPATKFHESKKKKKKKKRQNKTKKTFFSPPRGKRNFQVFHFQSCVWNKLAMLVLVYYQTSSSNLEIKIKLTENSSFAYHAVSHGFLVEITVTTGFCMVSTSSHNLKLARCY